MTNAIFQSAEAGHVGLDLPFNPFWYGVITLTIAVALLGLLWSFRNTLALDPVDHHHDDVDTAGTHRATGSHH
jgi:hypothetical protein